MRWVDLEGTPHEGLVLSSALDTLANADRAGLFDLQAARLELMQVIHGGPAAVAEKVGLDFKTLKAIRNKNWFKLTAKAQLRLDDLWDRTYAILKYGQ